MGVPIVGIIVFWGSILGSPYLGNLLNLPIVVYKSACGILNITVGFGGVDIGEGVAVPLYHGKEMLFSSYWLLVV